MTHLAISADGTTIGYDREGTGPVVILVGGAMQFRAFDPVTQELAHALAGHGFTVVNYDRRGRGQSHDAPSMTLHDNIVDLRAIVAELERTDDVGDGVALFGNSSGGAIALAAAAGGLPVTGMVLFEVPLDEEQGPGGAEFLAGLRERIAGHDPDAVVEYFMKDMPPEWLEGAKQSAAWPLMVRIGPSLEADSEALAWTQSAPRRDLWGHVIAPTLVLTGDQTLDVMTPAAESIASTLPNAERRTIPATDHAWDPHVMATTIADFLHERAGQ